MTPSGDARFEIAAFVSTTEFLGLVGTCLVITARQHALIMILAFPTLRAYGLLPTSDTASRLLAFSFSPPFTSLLLGGLARGMAQGSVELGFLFQNPFKEQAPDLARLCRPWKPG
ncbi:hypothetical protein HJFPF1_00609 [Paramyrothecium foliicola]|nr:hypothetical protein HJFPF1_00609 [Paramyrothecium foliicola]